MWIEAGISGLLPMIGERVLIQRVLTWIQAGIGGPLPIIGERVLIQRVLSWIKAGIGEKKSES